MWGRLPSPHRSSQIWCFRLPTFFISSVDFEATCTSWFIHKVLLSVFPLSCFMPKLKMCIKTLLSSPLRRWTALWLWSWSMRNTGRSGSLWSFITLPPRTSNNHHSRNRSLLLLHRGRGEAEQCPALTTSSSEGWKFSRHNFTDYIIITFFFFNWLPLRWSYLN